MVNSFVLFSLKTDVMKRFCHHISINLSLNPKTRSLLLWRMHVCFHEIGIEAGVFLFTPAIEILNKFLKNCFLQLHLNHFQCFIDLAMFLLC